MYLRVAMGRSLLKFVLPVPNQTGDEYVMMGILNDLYKSVSEFQFMRGYSLNKRVYALFMVLLICMFQFIFVWKGCPSDLGSLYCFVLT
jgi:hypothetical protein